MLIDENLTHGLIPENPSRVGSGSCCAVEKQPCGGDNLLFVRHTARIQIIRDE